MGTVIMSAKQTKKERKKKLKTKGKNIKQSTQTERFDHHFH
jgi:hypothetical protein